jgi:hypothetical protein
MPEPHHPVDQILRDLEERAKELGCLYRVDELLSRPGATEEDLQQLVEEIPTGWQYSEACRARIVIGDRVYRSKGFAACARSSA